MPRKRRRTAWTAASEGSSFTYTTADTAMTLSPSGVFRIARTEKPARQLHFSHDDIADFPQNQPSQLHLQQPTDSLEKQRPRMAADDDDVAVLSFGSDGISPAKPPPIPAASDPIDESPLRQAPLPQCTPSQQGVSAADTPTPPTAFVARSLLSAMDQAIPTPDKGAMRSASKPPFPRIDDKMSTPLMVTTSEIRRAQQTLGFSPSTPTASGIRFIDPELEKELRAVQNSTMRMMLDVDDVSLHSGPSRGETPLKGAEQDGTESAIALATRLPVGRKPSSRPPAVHPQPGSTPIRARRRLSDMSTVTPIPLNLESPTVSRGEVIDEQAVEAATLMTYEDTRLRQNGSTTLPNVKGTSLGMPLATDVKGVPIQISSTPKNLASPITPQHQHQNNGRKLAMRQPSDATLKPHFTPSGAKTPCSSSFITGKGVPLHPPPISGPSEPAPNNLTSFQKSNSAAFPSLFTTGSGKKVDMPPLRKTNSGTLLRNPPAGPPLFTTGSGKKVNIPQLLITTGSGKGVEIPPLLKPGFGHSNKSTHASRPLFTTGSGKAVDGKVMHDEGLDTAQKGFDISSLFSTGRGNAIAVPKHTNSTNLHALSPRNPCTPFVERGGVTNVIREPVNNALVSRSGKKVTSGLVVPKSIGSGNRSRTNVTSKARTGLKCTPFKRPRQLLRRETGDENQSSAKKTICAPVPNIVVPPLLKSGRILCQVPEHHCKNQAQTSALGPPDFILQAGCLKQCLGFLFSKDRFGDCRCLPAEVGKLLDLECLTEFGVQDCMTWMNSLFPTVSAKPASCIGSIAWTKLSYSLAVWKLSRLDLAENSRSGTGGSRFLCVANVIREFLRRLSYEWHGNRQPHLLRMLRRDSSPASHVVLVIADIEENEEKHLLLTVSDGWYVARAVIDLIIEKRILHGKLQIGQKVHVSGAVLQSVSQSRELFCGEGDELSSNMLRISANNMRMVVNDPREKLGIQRGPLLTSSLKWIKADAGLCPTVLAVVLRSYPNFYMEKLPAEEQDDMNNEDSAPEYLFRRADAEFEARSAFEENIRQKMMAAVEEKGGRPCGGDREMPEIPKRDVLSVKEVIICGISDDPRDPDIRKVVRIYNPPDVQGFLAEEGQVVYMAHLWPKQHNRWTGKPETIRRPRKKITADLLVLFPRRICSIMDLHMGTLAKGTEFDGVFIVLHVSIPSDDGERRFVYLTDNVGSDVRILALEMSGGDVDCLPKALRVKTGHGPKFPPVVMQDVAFQAVSPEHQLVHAHATLRTSFASSRAISRKRFSGHLKKAFMHVETQARGKETQLEILKEAVVSFASGTRRSIGAYFTSTQDM